ncbi:EAL domain-containing protein [Mobilitalea sibirica]|uniref:EAL domain-containing protein n=1 Tax=Mobilitalea sibirica TaxID=1462919 RepID=A0A8J7H3U9_9FIRM|nr:EAL domain-containing protein [Mobilitalea sibirica]MBH1941760.1 EAL domain-containing protein [Mobilitalea sibirica]
MDNILDSEVFDNLNRKYNLLKQNMDYSQKLMNLGSWTHHLLTDEVFLSDGIYDIIEIQKKNSNLTLEEYYKYVHPDDLDKVKTTISKSLHSNDYDIEYRLLLPDNVEKYIYEKTKVLYNNKGNPYIIIGIIQDISHQKSLEKEWKSFRDDLNQAQKVAGFGSWKYYQDKDYINWSEEVYHIYNVKPQDLKKDFNSFISLIHPEDQENVKNKIRECFLGQPYEVEYRILLEDNSVKYIIGKGEPIYNSNNDIVGILGTVHDITEKKILEIKIKRALDNLSNAQALAHIGSWEVDLSTGKHYWSDETYRIYGITPSQYDNSFEGFLEYVHPMDRHIILNVMEYPPEEDKFDMEFRIVRPDGSIRNAYQIMEIIYDVNKKPIYIYGTIQDITEKKQLEKKLEHTEIEIQKMQKQNQSFQTDSKDFFMLISSSGVIFYISHISFEDTGFRAKEVIGKNISVFFTNKNKFKLNDMLNAVLESSDKSVKEIISYVTRLGKLKYFEIKMTNYLSDPDIKGIAVYWNNITDRIEAERKMIYIATHDELTKLPNRYYMEKRMIQQPSSSSSKLSTTLILIEMNEYKFIQDSLGYKAADQLLVKFTKRLKEYLSKDVFLCRYSTDQFVIILDNNSKINCERIAQDIVNLFSQSFKVDNYELFIAVSLGISTYPEDGQNFIALMKHANSALIRSRERGKNKYQFYSPDMGINNYKDFELRNDLHKAIEREQIRIYYQPLVDLKTNEILAVEALIRWEHPVWGLVPPNEFLSIASETGLIIELGKWMLKEACRNYKQWIAEKLPSIKVSLNYSALQFYEKDFVDNIKSIINEFQLDPNFIIIEITESVLIDRLDNVISDIKKLREMGIHIALDDFGTGFSSLAYLNNMHIDVIKIDRSFIMNMSTDERSLIIITAIIKMAQELRIKIVAEGIEDWEQLLMLRRLNCHVGQGFLYSRPVSALECKKLLRKRFCKPQIVNNVDEKPFVERRKYFRVQFHELLEGTITILKIGEKQAGVGNSKVLIKNMGPGGLCFISNIRFPVRRDIILQFTTQLLGTTLKVFGCPAWSAELEENYYEYGIEFTFDENDRMNVTKILNQYQIKLKNNRGFQEGAFVSSSIKAYFNSLIN